MYTYIYLHPHQGAEFLPFMKFLPFSLCVDFCKPAAFLRDLMISMKWPLSN